MLGYSKAELLSLSIKDIHPTKEMRRVLAAFYRLSRGQAAVVTDIPMKRKDGSSFYADISCSRAEFFGRKYLVGFFRDVTERKRSKTALDESEEMFRTLTERSPNMIFINQGGKVVYANPQCVKVMGYTRSEFYSPRFNFLTLIHPEDIPTVRRNFFAHQRGKEVAPCEYKMITKGGKMIRGILTSKLIHYQDAPAILGIVTDITERKQAEEEIRKALSLERATLGSTEDGILVVENHTRRVTDFNSQFSRLWHIPKKVLRSREDEKLLGYVLSRLKDPKGFLSKVKELYKYPRRESFDLLEFKDGRVFERYSRPQILDGKPVGRVWSFRDITGRKQMERELKSAKERLEHILGVTKTGVNVVDADFNLRYVDPTWQKIYGDPSGRKCYEYFMGRKKVCPGCGIPRALRTRKVAITEEILPREGNRKIEVHTIPFQNSEGEWLVAEFNIDITARKQAEADLQSSEQRYRSIFQSSHDAMMTIEPPSWRFTSANIAMARMFRAKNVAAILARSPWALSPKRQPDGRLSSEKAMEMIRTAILKGAHFFEWTHRRFDGATFPSEVLLTKVAKDGVVLLQATVRDITERKQAEDFLKGHRRQLLQVIDTVPHMIFAEDGKGRFLLVNRAVAQSYGKEPKDLIGVLRQDVHKVREEVESYLESGREVLASGKLKVVPGEFFTDVHGRRHILQTIKIPFQMVGAKEECVLGVSVDITEHRKVEEFRNEIVRTVSHELRTPLSIEKEGISLLMDEIVGPVNAEQKEILEAVMRSIDRLSRMISNLLDVSSIETGKVRLIREMKNLEDIIKDVLLDFKKRASKKGIDLSVKLLGRPVEVFLDPDKITQVLSNLVDNAVKFTPEGGVVQISLVVLEDEVECEVRDTGIGIAPENVGKAFEKFLQFSREDGPGEKGFGLGLAIAKGIIELHGGRIWIESKLGKGTRATFSLPLHQRKEA